MFINKLWLLEWVSEKVTDNWSRCEASSDSVESSGANWGVVSEELIRIFLFASIANSGSSLNVTFFSGLSAACITRDINISVEDVVVLFSINFWVVLFVSIEIDVVEIFNIVSALSSSWVVFDDFIGDFDFFTSESESLVVVDRTAWVIGGTAEFLVNFLSIEFFSGSVSLNDTISISPDRDDFSINHNTSSSAWDESIFPVNIGVGGDFLVFLAEGAELSISGSSSDSSSTAVLHLHNEIISEFSAVGVHAINHASNLTGGEGEGDVNSNLSNALWLEEDSKVEWAKVTIDGVNWI